MFEYCKWIKNTFERFVLRIGQLTIIPPLLSSTSLFRGIIPGYTKSHESLAKKTRCILQSCDLETMVSRLKCTRVHFVKVSVSRPEDPCLGLGLQTWSPRSRSWSQDSMLGAYACSTITVIFAPLSKCSDTTWNWCSQCCDLETMVSRLKFILSRSQFRDLKSKVSDLVSRDLKTHVSVLVSRPEVQGLET